MEIFLKEVSEIKYKVATNSQLKATHQCSKPRTLLWLI